MATLNGQKARRKLKKTFARFEVSKSNLPRTRKLRAGKLYELYAVSRLLLELKSHGYSFIFSDPTIAFKTGGGPIKVGDFHVDVREPNSSCVGRIYTDVEVLTLGSRYGRASDLSRFHETDIVIVDADTTGYPQPGQVFLAIECKATAKFQKVHIREVLGRRLELSFFPVKGAFFTIWSIFPAGNAFSYAGYTEPIGSHTGPASSRANP